MAKFRLDLRPVLRAIATEIQDENVRRLLGGQGVAGETLAPEKQPPAATGKKRVRVLGVRRSLAELAAVVGIRSGAMLRDLGRRANQKIGRVGFKITPSADVRLRFFAFVNGDKHQVSRPVS